MLRRLKNFLLGGKPEKERRRLPPPGELPMAGRYIAMQNLLMRISEPIPSELWDWLVLMNWRETRMANNKRRYFRLPDDTISKLAQASQMELEAIYQDIIRATTNRNHPSMR